MKYIGNILTDEPFEKNDLLNVVHDVDELKPGIPTLIVGWERTKEIYPSASIIEFEVTDIVYWTYGKYEKRDKYEANVTKFFELAFKKFVETLKYVFYDVIFEDDKRFAGFIDLLKNKFGKTVYVTNNMLYIYVEGTDKVIGLSLRDCDYISGDHKKQIFSEIYNNPTIKYLRNNDEISKEVRYKAGGRTYILPYLYS